jgi:DNA-binding FadR family transcriptional regulator
MTNTQKLEILKALNHPNHNRIYQYGAQAEQDALLAAVRSGDPAKVREVLNAK